MARQFSLKVQDKVNKGWRKEAQKLGQLWDVTRNGTVVLTNQPYVLQRWTRSADIEFPPLADVFRVRGDRKKLKIGDQFIGKDIESKREQSALTERYTLVAMRLLHDNIVVKTDKACKIFRPNQIGDFGEDIPYSLQTVKKNRKVLVQNPTTHVWSFDDVDESSATTAWCGLTLSRYFDYRLPVPTPQSTQATGWIVGLGLLNGVTFRTDDIVVDPDDNWYRVDRAEFRSSGAFVNILHATQVKA